MNHKKDSYMELPKILESGDNVSFERLTDVLSFSSRVHLDFLKKGQNDRLDRDIMEFIHTIPTRLLCLKERNPLRISNLMKRLVDKFQQLQKSRLYFDATF